MMNLLALASSVIPTTPVWYRRSIGQAENDVGVLAQQYAQPLEVPAHVQALSRTRADNLGLDASQTYVTIFAARRVMGVERDLGGDRFNWGGATWQVLPETTDWYRQDGWAYALAVRLGQTNAGC